jgi:predicted ATPase/predicted negative regulator of RcsB-dependent stress response
VRGKEEQGRAAGVEATPDLVGRTREILALRRLLIVERYQVVTVWGPGGIGKTRLVREVAGGGASAFPGGVHFCELAETRRPEEVVALLAEVLALSATSPSSHRESVQRIGRSLAMRGRTLVVLDNVEQILGEIASALRVWTVLAPEAAFLLTSRQVLGFPGEARLELPPLALSAETGDVRDSDAVRLLLRRARAVRPEFDAPIETLQEIVASLDGIPLAIELCAAHLGVLSLEQVRERLDRRFDLLATTQPAVEPRQRTMRGVMDRSFYLLDEIERDLLAELSVFSGAFDLAAAEAVTFVAERCDVAHHLSSLRDKSLLVPAPAASGSPSMTMLETIRAYARDKLEARTAEVRDRHAAYFVGRASELAARADGANGGQAVAWLARERKNLIAALDHFLDAPSRERAAMALAAMAPLRRVLADTGGIAVLLDVGARVLAQARLHDVDQAVLLRAVEAQGLALFACGKLDESRAHLEEAHDLAHRASLADRARTARSLGMVQMVLGRSEPARKLLEAALAASREAGDRHLEAQCLASLGSMHHFSDRFEPARERYEQALAIHHEIGNVRAEAHSRTQLGFVLQDLGVAGAGAQYERAAALLRSRGGGPLEAQVAGYRGNALREEGRFDEAHAAYSEAIRRLQLAGERTALVFTMDRAILLELQGRMGEAAAELDALAPLAAEVGGARLAALTAGYRAIAQAALGDAACARAALASARDRGHVTAEFLDLHSAHVVLFEARGAASGKLMSAAVSGARASLAKVGESPQGIHVRLAARLLRTTLERTVPPLDALLVTEHRDRARAPGGAWIDLRGRLNVLAVFSRLVDARLSAPGEPVSTNVLVKAGWPGERMLAASGQNRLRVLVASLRTQGLHGLLRTERGGYLLDPGVPLVVGDPPCEGELM